MQMIGDAKQSPKPFDCILVHKFDRFARNREDSVVYKSLLRKECGIKVISVTEQMEDDKFAIILESMLEAMAEYYSLNLSDEVKKGMTEKALRGELQTPAPLGYKMTGGILTPVSEEADLVRLIFELYVNKNMTTAQIASYLSGIGALTKKGNRFKKRSVVYIIKNPVYKGMARWNLSKNNVGAISGEGGAIIVKGRHVPIVGENIWSAANRKLSQDIPQRKKVNEAHYLSGVLKCGRCHGNMYISGKDNRLFRCGNYLNGKCGYSQGISITRMERKILEKITTDIAPEISLRPKEEQVRFIKEHVYKTFFDKQSGSVIIKLIDV